MTGIGGVFFLSSGDDVALREWYRETLGFEFEDFGGAVLQWQADPADDGGMTVWHVAESGSEWFQPSASRFMINYRIDDMEGMVARLKGQDVEIIQGPETHENGIFVWVMDPEGNKVELWEPKQM